MHTPLLFDYHSSLLIIVSAFFLDLVAGDPRCLPHPVRWIGRYIMFVETNIRKVARTRQGELAGGAILFFTVVSGVFIFTWLTFQISSLVSVYLSSVLSVYIAFTAIAARSLHKDANTIIDALKKNQLDTARRKLSLIVGRDTGSLSYNEICKAIVETVAENASDGVIAPLFYLAIGGPMTAIVYKTINTLDSMVGYNNVKYRYIGWCSAKMDDAANYIPSRITALLFVAASFFMNLDWKKSASVAWSEGRYHLSPNSGYPEAAAAGAMGVSLGGGSRYAGVFVKKPVLGKGLGKADTCSARTTTYIMYIASFLMLLCITVVKIAL